MSKELWRTLCLVCGLLPVSSNRFTSDDKKEVFFLFQFSTQTCIFLHYPFLLCRLNFLENCRTVNSACSCFNACCYQVVSTRIFFYFWLNFTIKSKSFWNFGNKNHLIKKVHLKFLNVNWFPSLNISGGFFYFFIQIYFVYFTYKMLFYTNLQKLQIYTNIRAFFFQSKMRISRKSFFTPFSLRVCRLCKGSKL